MLEMPQELGYYFDNMSPFGEKLYGYENSASEASFTAKHFVGMSIRSQFFF